MCNRIQPNGPPDVIQITRHRTVHKICDDKNHIAAVGNSGTIGQHPDGLLEKSVPQDCQNESAVGAGILRSHSAIFQESEKIFGGVGWSSQRPGLLLWHSSILTKVRGFSLVRAMYRIIVGDDQDVYRAGVITLLAGSDTSIVLAECSDWNGLVETVKADAGSVIIASLSLVADIEELIARAERARSRVLLVVDDSDILGCYRSSGAAGVVHRSTSVLAFLEALRKIRMGADFVLPVEGTWRRELGHGLAGSLTPGESKIVALLLEGCKNRRIAEYLDIAEHVVKSSLQKIFDKTGFSTRVELALFLSTSGRFACETVERSTHG